MIHSPKKSFSLLAFTAALLLIGCDKAPKGDNAVITDQVLPEAGGGQTLVVYTTSSRIRFTGHGVGKNHPESVN